MLEVVWFYVASKLLSNIQNAVNEILNYLKKTPWKTNPRLLFVVAVKIIETATQVSPLTRNLLISPDGSIATFLWTLKKTNAVRDTVRFNKMSPLHTFHFCKVNSFLHGKAQSQLNHTYILAQLLQAIYDKLFMAKSCLKLPTLETIQRESKIKRFLFSSVPGRKLFCTPRVHKAHFADSKTM